MIEIRRIGVRLGIQAMSPAERDRDAEARLRATGEGRMLSKAINRALSDIRAHTIDAGLRSSARWFLLDDDSPLPEIAEALGLDLEAIRKEAREGVAEARAGAARRRVLDRERHRRYEARRREKRRAAAHG